MSLTLAIIKPDAVGSGLAGKILGHLQDQGFTVRALKMTRLAPSRPERFMRSIASGHSMIRS